jgi:hypothetical protein
MKICSDIKRKDLIALVVKYAFYTCHQLKEPGEILPHIFIL